MIRLKELHEVFTKARREPNEMQQIGLYSIYAMGVLMLIPLTFGLAGMPGARECLRMPLFWAICLFGIGMGAVVVVRYRSPQS